MKADHGEKVTITVELELFRTTKNKKRLASAITRAIEHAVFNDIDGTSILNEDTVATIHAEVAA